jgi:Zn-dependent protease
MTLAGFPISVHGSWYIVLALLTWILARTYFPEIAPGTSAVLCTLAALLAALALFACLLLHELAHSVVAHELGHAAGADHHENAGLMGEGESYESVPDYPSAP